MTRSPVSPLLPSLLIGLVAGQRSMTPLAALAAGARRGRLGGDTLGGVMMARPAMAHGGVALAAAEIAGDKMKTAPDRTVLLGLMARTITGGFAGATLAPAQRQPLGAALGIAAAVASSYLGLAARKRAMHRWGQTASGFAEDAIVLVAALAVVGAVSPSSPPR